MTGRELWIVHPPHKYLEVTDLPGWENKCGTCSRPPSSGDHAPDGGILHTHKIAVDRYDNYPERVINMMFADGIRSMSLEATDGN